MLKVPNITVFEWSLFNFNGGLIFVTFVLTLSSVSTAGLVLAYFTRPVGPAGLRVSFTHTDVGEERL